MTQLRRLFIFVVLIVFSTGLNTRLYGQSDPRFLLADLKIRAALVRINCIELTTYTYQDPLQILRTRKFISGSVGCGIIIHPDGYILTDRHTISPILNFNDNYDSYIAETRAKILTQVFQQENISPAEPRRWMERNEFKILNSKLLKNVVLANRISLNFNLAPLPAGEEKNTDLFLLKIDLDNLPFVELQGQKNRVDDDYLYYIQGDEDQNDLLPYVINLEYQYRVIRRSVPEYLSLESGRQPEWSTLPGKLERMFLNHSWYWIGAGGRVSRFITFLPEGIRVFDSPQIKDFLTSRGLTEFPESPFNREIQTLMNKTGELSRKQWENRLNRISTFFYPYTEVNEIKQRILASVNQKEESGSFWRRLNPARLFNRLKFFLLGFFILLLLVLLVVLFRRIGKNKEKLEDPPEIPVPEPDPEPDSENLTIEIGDQGKYEFSLDVYVNGEFQQTCPITSETTTIGRDPSLVDLVIPELIVSKYHCTILKIDRDVFIRDENSTNGLFDSDKKKIKEKKLEDNENISLGKRGKVKLIFRKRNPENLT